MRSGKQGTSVAEMAFHGSAMEQAGSHDRARALNAFRLGDRAFYWITRISAILVLLLLGGIIVSLIVGSWPAIVEFGSAFLTTQRWAPSAEPPVLGALSPLYGTILTSAIAMAIAIPVGIGIAVFLTELCPLWARRPIGMAIELLAGIPSIIYGMWGLFVFAPFMAENIDPWLDEHLGSVPYIGALFSGPPLGLGMLTAGIVLGIMVIPFISSVMRDVFQTVPSRLKESAYALGSTRWEVVWHVILPYTRSAVIGGIFLGLGRALGETMAVTFVLGNAHELSASLLMPGNSIAATIANEFTEADSEIYLSSLIALGFLLFVVTFIVLALAKLMLMRLSQREGNR